MKTTTNQRSFLDLPALAARAGANRRKAGGAAPATSTAAAPRHGAQIRLSVGIDLVTVVEVSASLDRFRDRYIRRLFTAREAAYCQAGRGAVSAARFAARFAAKEATIKALEPARPWADWRTIEVRRNRSGRCSLVLHGEAAALARRRGIDNLALSMSHDHAHAAAIVVAFRTARAADRASRQR